MCYCTCDMPHGCQSQGASFQQQGAILGMKGWGSRGAIRVDVCWEALRQKGGVECCGTLVVPCPESCTLLHTHTHIHTYTHMGVVHPSEVSWRDGGVC